MGRVIFTADDFGLAPEVNAAVAEAHRRGVLSAASLMVGAPAAAEAIAIARAMPTLAVGLHVVVADGAPVLPPSEIPALVDENGQLPSDLVRAGVRMFMLPGARRQLRREIAAQFAAFAATGLPCDHVNVHNHMHLHPTVLGAILPLARAAGVRRIRLPYENGQLALAPWVALVRRRLRREGFVFNDRIAGLAHTGHMTEPRVLAALDRAGPGTTEFYFHPAVRTTPALERAAAGYDRVGELQALTSPRVAARIRERGLALGGFRDIAA
jgi:hopanoid biosynthesis associated protein HpnK